MRYYLKKCLMIHERVRMRPTRLTTSADAAVAASMTAPMTTVAADAESAVPALWKMDTVKKTTALIPQSCWLAMRKMAQRRGRRTAGSRMKRMLEMRIDESAELEAFWMAYSSSWMSAVLRSHMRDLRASSLRPET